MFDIHSVRLVNFRSYVGEHSFEFPTTRGLYYLTGLNIAEPNLGANGAGKSTLLDAIKWCLYGTTMRGLKAAEVLSWDNEVSCTVTLELTVGPNKLLVKRTQKPNSLSINGTPAAQDDLQKYIRLTAEAFDYSVISGQFGESFMSLKPTEKLSLFSDIYNLGMWLEKADEASTLAKQQEAEITVARLNIAKREGTVASLQEDIKDLKARREAFDADKAEKRDEIARSSVKIFKTIRKIGEEREETKKVRRSLLKEHNKALTKVDAAALKRDEFLEKISTVSKRRNRLEGKQDQLHTQIHRVHDLVGGECPTCFQKVGDVHRVAYGSAARDDLKEIVTAIMAIDTVTQSLTGEMVKAKLAVDAASGEANRISDELDEVDATLKEGDERAISLKANMDDLGERLHELEASANPYATMIRDKRAKVAQLQEAIADAVNATDTKEAEFEATKFWVKGFKRVRLFIIEQAFKTLELEVNNSLAQLGMTDWQITFDIERENKSGGITKGFVVFIQGPRNKEPVRWENWSGGETQRLQLAGDLGLANLIMQQNGLTNTIEFYDEPSTHLSPEGMVDLANMLHDRALSENKRIWIVDHTAVTNFGGFEGVLTIRKDENGSAITYENS